MSRPLTRGTLDTGNWGRNDNDIQHADSLKSMFFGSEDLFLATLRDTGTVLLQSLPCSRIADRILQHAPRTGGTQKGEGS